MFQNLPASSMKVMLPNTFSLLFTAAVLISCSKKEDDLKTVDPVTEVVPATDPVIAGSIGFFMDNWQAKTFVAPSFTELAPPGTASVTVTVDASQVITKIPPGIFGHNANTWMGMPSVYGVTDIKNLNPNIIRFPGGNLSNSYFWNASQDQAPKDVPENYIDKDGKANPAYWVYGKTNHDWEMKLDQYYDLLAQTNSKGMISINYSYARYSTAANPVASAAHLAADWVRYDNGRTPYWEIGNEHYGDWQIGYRIDQTKNKDGQPEFITGELYGKHVQVFVDSMQKAAREIGKTIYIGAVAQESQTESWQTNTTKTWNSGMFKAAGNKPDFYIAHNYFTPYDQNSNTAVIIASALSEGSKMMNFVQQEMQRYGATPKPVAMTEWNMWAKDSKQQVSNVSGLFAVIVQAEAIKNKYGMSSRWDLLNGWDNGNDHGLFSNGDEGVAVPKWSPRPSFHHMYFFHKLLGDRMVPATVSNGTSIIAYGSTYSSGEANVSLVNASGSDLAVDVKFRNFNAGNRFYWYSLAGENDNGEFSRKVTVNGIAPTVAAGGPVNYETIKARSATTASGVRVTVPARGAVYLVVTKK